MIRLDRTPSLNVGSWLSAQAGRRPDATALIDAERDQRFSYAELNALSNRIAARLLEDGVEPGDRVALGMRSESFYAAFYFAVTKIGGIFLPLNTRLAPDEWKFQLADAEPRVAVHDASLGLISEAPTRTWSLDEFRSSLPKRAAEPVLRGSGEDPHVLMYTSGTTGTPKGALLPHRKTLYNTLNAELYFELWARDVIVVPVPLFHSFGLKILSVPAFFAGATVVLVNQFDPRSIQDVVEQHRATVLAGVPVMFRRMANVGLDAEKLASVRFAFSAGAPLDAATVRAFAAHGVALRQGYGQTETSILCTLPQADVLRKIDTVGKPVHYAELRIADEDGKTLPAGFSGEVQVRGPICMLGYWRRAGETRAALQDGWHRTGDLGQLDDEGFLRLVGRLKEMYISGGENVYPAEVEHVLEQHPNVAEAAVVGVAHPEWGETGRAYVVALERPLDADAVLRWCRARLAGYKCPRELVVVDELPRTASGKVQKHRLHELDAGAGGAARGVRADRSSSA